MATRRDWRLIAVCVIGGLLVLHLVTQPRRRSYEIVRATNTVPTAIPATSVVPEDPNRPISPDTPLRVSKLLASCPPRKLEPHPVDFFQINSTIIPPGPPMSPAFRNALLEYQASMQNTSRRLLCICFGGIGNVALVFSSCFVLGMLTNRQVMLDWGDSTDLFWAEQSWAWDPVKDPKPANFAKLTLTHLPATLPDYKRLGCTDMNESFPEDYLVVEANQYFVPMLWANGHYTARLNAMFPKGYEMFGPLARYLFRPNKAMQAAVEQFYLENFSNYTVAVHVRSQENAGNYNPVNEERIISCIRQYYPDLDKTPCARLYVASMHRETYARFRREFGAERIFPSGPSSFAENHSVTGREQALIETWRLTLGRDFFASSLSTFSYVVGGLGVPRQIMAGNFTCGPPIMNEPCMHVWGRPGFDLHVERVCGEGKKLVAPKRVDRTVERYKYC